MGRILLCAFIFWIYSCVDCGHIKRKIGPQPLWNSTYVDNLRKDLLLNYDKFARPTQHYNKTTVEFTVTILHIDVNEFKSTVTVNGWIKMKWNDEKLKWNEDEYGGLQVLHLAEHEVWQPDVHLYNSAANTALNHYAGAHCLAYSSGEVLWVPPAQFTVLCEMNFKYWPFDTQDCCLKFGSWTYHGNQIDLQLYSNTTSVETQLLVTNSEWTLVNATQKRSSTLYSCCEEPYPDITVNFTITRSSPSYKATIITPAFVVIFLTLMVFWLPPQSGEKVIMNVTTTLIICLLMIYFSQKLPAMRNHTPLIVLFYSSCLYVSTFSLIGSVVVITLSRTKHNRPLPWVIKHALTGSFGKLLGLNSYIRQSAAPHRVTAEEMRDHQVTDFDAGNSGDEHHIIKSPTTQQKSSHQHEWILLAAAIDRISFVFYSLLFCILSVVYSI